MSDMMQVIGRVFATGLLATQQSSNASLGVSILSLLQSAAQLLARNELAQADLAALETEVRAMVEEDRQPSVEIFQMLNDKIIERSARIQDVDLS